MLLVAVEVSVALPKYPRMALDAVRISIGLYQVVAVTAADPPGVLPLELLLMFMR